MLRLKNYRNGGVWQSGILKSLAEYVQCCVCFVNVQSSLHDNVVFSVCALTDNVAYIMFIMWNSISGLDAWYHFRFNISCGVAVMGNFLRGGEGGKTNFGGEGEFFRSSSLLGHLHF